jgi:ribonuclease BN (tRNA processing enzyme)
MDIRVLGAHNSETNTTSCISLLIDKTLAIEAGGLTAHLTIAEQADIEAVIVTHKHMDHIRDIPNLALDSFRSRTSFGLYATAAVCSSIKEHLLNGVIYPEFQKIPENKPTVCFMEMEPLCLQWIDGHAVMPIPVQHAGSAVGYQINDKKDRTVFFTGDTGPGLEECWRHTRPQLLIVDVTMRNDCEDFARSTGHLTPNLLETELISFRAINGYLPSILAIHMDAILEPNIKTELEAVKERLQAEINIAHEGMTVTV